MSAVTHDTTAVDSVWIDPGDDQTIIDFRTEDGYDFFENACAPLKYKFDCTIDNLAIMLSELSNKAFLYGWYNSVLMIVDHETDDEQRPAVVNLITNHADVTLEQIKAHVCTYVSGHNRAAQDSMAMYRCLSNSLTHEMRQELNLSSDDYTVNGIVSGAMFLKVLIVKTCRKRNYQVRMILMKLSSLDQNMKTVHSDVVKFMAHVRDLLLALAALGETTSDLLIYLFKGLKAAADKDFVEYIEWQESNYDEGHDIDPMELMRLALRKYHASVATGTWMKPYVTDEMLVALREEVKALAENNNKTATNNNSFKANKYNKKKKNKRNGKPKWMATEPAKHASHRKLVNGVEYIWCIHHKSWGKHASHDCRQK